MADVCDMAADHMEAEAHMQAVHAALRAGVRELHPKGRCFNPQCELDLFDADGKLSKTKLFCDAVCSSEFEQAKRAGKGRRPQ